MRSSGSRAAALAVVWLLLIPITALGGGEMPPVVKRMVTRASALEDAGKPCKAHALLTRPPTRLSAKWKKRLRRRARKTLKNTEISARHCTAYLRVTRLQRQARAGKAASVTLRLDTTVGWGCPCAPLVYAGIRGTNLDELFIYPRASKGVKDPVPATTFPGTLRLTGRFTGRAVDRYQWATLRGKRPPPRTGDRVAYYKKRHPLFTVERWCFSPRRRLSAEWRKELKTAVPRRFRCKKR